MSIAIVQCQWVTFEEWLFATDNDTVRLARIFECDIYSLQPTVIFPKERLSTDQDYSLMPIIIVTFVEDLAKLYAETLALYGVGECHSLISLSDFPSTMSDYPLENLMHQTGRNETISTLDIYGFRNRYLRSQQNR